MIEIFFEKEMCVMDINIQNIHFVRCTKILISLELTKLRPTYVSQSYETRPFSRYIEVKHSWM